MRISDWSSDVCSSDLGRRHMTDTRARRQKLIAEMIRSGTVSSQEDVTAKLAEQGIAVTQATVSRDLDQMGAVKVKRGGVLGYALPDQMAANDYIGRASRRERVCTYV